MITTLEFLDRFEALKNLIFSKNSDRSECVSKLSHLFLNGKHICEIVCKFENEI